MTKYIWICVEADEYELPLAVADTARELAEMMGTTKHNIDTFVSKGCNGKLSGRKFMKIPNDE